MKQLQKLPPANAGGNLTWPRSETKSGLGYVFGLFAVFFRMVVAVFFFKPVLHVADRVLYFAFNFLGGALHLGFFISRPFTGFALYASGNVFGFPFDSILIHKSSSTGYELTLVSRNNPSARSCISAG